MNPNPRRSTREMVIDDRTHKRLTKMGIPLLCSCRKHEEIKVGAVIIRKRNSGSRSTHYYLKRCYERMLV